MKDTTSDVLTASVDGYIECSPTNFERLCELAAKADDDTGADRPQAGYSLDSALAAVLNGSTTDEIASAFQLLAGWSFSPEGGWK